MELPADYVAISLSDCIAFYKIRPLKENESKSSSQHWTSHQYDFYYKSELVERYPVSASILDICREWKLNQLDEDYVYVNMLVAYDKEN